jgi:hypothetical protein
MNFKIMPKAAFPDWVARLCTQFRVVGPRQKHGQYVFDVVEDVADLELHYPTSVLPPKKYLVPQKEVLLNYRLDGSRLEVVKARTNRHPGACIPATSTPSSCLTASSARASPTSIIRRIGKA